MTKKGFFEMGRRGVFVAMLADKDFNETLNNLVQSIKEGNLSFYGEGFITDELDNEWSYAITYDDDNVFIDLIDMEDREIYIREEVQDEVERRLAE